MVRHVTWPFKNLTLRSLLFRWFPILGSMCEFGFKVHELGECKLLYFEFRLLHLRSTKSIAQHNTYQKMFMSFQFCPMVSCLSSLAANLERVWNLGSRPGSGWHRFHWRHTSTWTIRTIHGHCPANYLPVIIFSMLHSQPSVPQWKFFLLVWVPSPWCFLL